MKRNTNSALSLLNYIHAASSDSLLASASTFSSARTIATLPTRSSASSSSLSVSRSSLLSSACSSGPAAATSSSLPAPTWETNLDKLHGKCLLCLWFAERHSCGDKASHSLFDCDCCKNDLKVAGPRINAEACKKLRTLISFSPGYGCYSCFVSRQNCKMQSGDGCSRKYSDLGLPVVLLVCRDAQIYAQTMSKLGLESIDQQSLHKHLGQPIKYEGTDMYVALAIFAVAIKIKKSLAINITSSSSTFPSFVWFDSLFTLLFALCNELMRRPESVAGCFC